MRRVCQIVVLLAVCVVLMPACRCFKAVQSEETSKDSIVIRTEYVERIDTAWITVTKEVQQVISDTSSMLENEWCLSRAEVRDDGRLFHSLETKPGKVGVEVKTVEKVRDTTIYKYRYVKEPYPVEKELSGWQKARINGFWYLFAALALCLAWMFRKPLFAFFLRIVGK